MAAMVEVSGLGKKYLLEHAGKQKPTSLREALAMKAGQALRQALGRERAEEREVFWALQDIDFTVQRGERLGIIGRNGAGKSTLLKLLSRITVPSKGRITLRGRVASLLEVGTGFHPELTGRENIFMNGAILGMRRREIKAKFDAIVAFSEVERFLDTPVKRYSSGMYMRLAFAVAAHLEPEILIVDEVLAVGDAAFQKKCLGKMREVGEEGRTILFVSHSMGAVSSLCQRALLLEGGRVKMAGPVAEVCSAYNEEAAGSTSLEPRHFQGNLVPALRFTRLSVNQGRAVLQPEEAVEVEVEGECLREVFGCRLQMSVFKGDVRLLTLQDGPGPCTLPQGRFRCRFTLPPCFLRPGEYHLALGASTGGHDWLWGADLLAFRINEAWGEGYEKPSEGLINLAVHGTRECC